MLRRVDAEGLASLEDVSVEEAVWPSARQHLASEDEALVDEARQPASEFLSLPSSDDESCDSFNARRAMQRYDRYVARRNAPFCGAKS
ncbi:MAG: hypothetical protein ACO32I_08985 [Candidatus Limnocylindrus sp.]